MTRPRHLRVVWDAETEKWVVQYSTTEHQTWTDVYRFEQSDEAVRYVEEIADRDRALLEGEQ